METTDPSVEWRRLQERYSQMSEDELQAVADEAYGLTDIARQVLQSEIVSRGLAISLAEKSSSAAEPEPLGDAVIDPAEMELDVVRRVWDMEEARSLKTILNGAGAPSWIGPQNLENFEEYKGSFERGVDVKVPAADQQRALAAMARAPEPESEEPADPEPGDENAYAVRCPKCNSTEVVFEGLEKDSPNESDFDATFTWTCEACGNSWKDDGVGKKA